MDVEPVLPGEVLDRLARLPLVTWTGGADGERRIGATAGEFRRLFWMADSEAAGVALASIQALLGRLTDLEEQVDRLSPPDARGSPGR